MFPNDRAAVLRAISFVIVAIIAPIQLKENLAKYLQLTTILDICLETTSIVNLPLLTLCLHTGYNTVRLFGLGLELNKLRYPEYLQNAPELAGEIQPMNFKELVDKASWNVDELLLGTVSNNMLEQGIP